MNANEMVKAHFEIQMIELRNALIFISFIILAYIIAALIEKIQDKIKKYKRKKENNK